MERQLDAYCEHLRSERQVSPHTLSAYRRDLDKVLGWCVKQNIGSWAALDIQRLRSLIARLHAQGQSSRSLARLLSAVRRKVNVACRKPSIPTVRCSCLRVRSRMIF